MAASPAGGPRRVRPLPSPRRGESRRPPRRGLRAGRALGAAVMAPIALAVALDTVDGHPRGPDRLLRHPAARHVDLDDASLPVRIQAFPLPPGLSAFLTEPRPIRNAARGGGPGYDGLLSSRPGASPPARPRQRRPGVGPGDDGQRETMSTLSTLEPADPPLL